MQDTILVHQNDIQRKNPRVNHRMPVKINLDKYQINGCTVDVSAFGATVEIAENDFNYLKNLDALPQVKVSTSIISVDAECNGLSNRENKFLVGIKLFDGFTWYGKSS